MKEASVESGSVQQKFDLLEDSLLKIIKGQNDLKVLAENSTKSNPDQLNVLNSRTSKLNEMSLVVSVCPKQVQADLRELHGDIFRVLTKDMEGVVRDIRSLNTRPAVTPMLPGQVVAKGSPQMNGMSVANGRPTMNQTPVANGRPLMNQTPVANGSPMIINQAPVGNGRSQLKQTPVTDGTPQRDLTPEINGRPQKDRIPVANGRPHMEQIPATKPLPACSTCATRASVLKPKLEQGEVKAAHMVGTSYRLAPTQKEVLNQKVNPQGPTTKETVERCTSRVILNMEPADLRKEVGSESCPQLVWGARKRRTRNETLSIDAATLLPGEGEKRRRGPGPEAQKDEAVHTIEAAPAKRAHRFNPKYDATQWITC